MCDLSALDVVGGLALTVSKVLSRLLNRSDASSTKSASLTISTMSDNLSGTGAQAALTPWIAVAYVFAFLDSVARIALSLILVVNSIVSNMIGSSGSIFRKNDVRSANIFSIRLDLDDVRRSGVPRELSERAVRGFLAADRMILNGNVRKRVKCKLR